MRYSLPGSPACTPCTGRPHSGGSQFFMNLTHNPRLDWFSPGASKHPVFGQITEGFDIAMEISEVSTARQPRTRSSLHRALTVQSAVHRPCTDRAHIPSYTILPMCTLEHTHTTHLRGAYDGRQPEHADYDEEDHDLGALICDPFCGFACSSGDRANRM